MAFLQPNRLSLLLILHATHCMLPLAQANDCLQGGHAPTTPASREQLLHHCGVASLQPGQAMFVSERVLSIAVVATHAPG